MTPAQQLERLKKLEERRCFRVIFCCSEFGDYADRQAAADRAAQLTATSDWTKAIVVEPTHLGDMHPEHAKDLLAETLPLLAFYATALAEARKSLEYLHTAALAEAGITRRGFIDKITDQCRRALENTAPEKELTSAESSEAP